jgi:hypothetical protein
LDSNGNFYIADTYNFFIRKVDGITQMITNFVGNRIYGFSGDDGPASFTDVFSLTLDPQQQNLFFF